MAIKGYTTEVPTHRTVGEIQQMLAEHGAERVSLDYEGKQASAVMFQIALGDERLRYRLPCRWQQIEKHLRADEAAMARLKKSGKKVDEVHCRAIGWRIIRDWLDAQLALINLEMAGLDEIMLPYMLLRDDKTVYDNFREQRAERLLESK